MGRTRQHQVLDQRIIVEVPADGGDDRVPAKAVLHAVEPIPEHENVVALAPDIVVAAVTAVGLVVAGTGEEVSVEDVVPVAAI